LQSVALLWNRTNPAAMRTSNTLQIAARDRGVRIVPLEVTQVDEIETSIDRASAELKRMHLMQKQPGTTPTTYKSADLTKLERFFEDIILTFIKPFDETKTDDDPDNYYMEREWRTVSSILFTLTDVKRVIIPEAYRSRLRENAPMYTGQVTVV
jgi:hypothetical protein